MGIIKGGGGGTRIPIKDCEHKGEHPNVVTLDSAAACRAEFWAGWAPGSRGAQEEAARCQGRTCVIGTIVAADTHQFHKNFKVSGMLRVFLG